MKQFITIPYYNWKVFIYYTISEEEKNNLITMFNSNNIKDITRESIINNLNNSSLDTGFIYSNYDDKYSIIVIHKASSIGEFINTFEHEKTHLNMHICDALDINPYSEKAAHLNGDISQLIIEKALYSIIEL